MEFEGEEDDLDVLEKDIILEGGITVDSIQMHARLEVKSGPQLLSFILMFTLLSPTFAPISTSAVTPGLEPTDMVAFKEPDLFGLLRNGIGVLSL